MVNFQRPYYIWLASHTKSTCKNNYEQYFIFHKKHNYDGQSTFLSAEKAFIAIKSITNARKNVFGCLMWSNIG